MQESEALLRTIAENYPNSYLSIIENDLTVGFTSGQEFKKQKLNPDQVVGMTLEQLFGDQAPVVREHYLSTFAGKEQSFELFFNDQHQFFRTSPLNAEDGTISTDSSVVENITERVQAQKALEGKRIAASQPRQYDDRRCWVPIDIEGKFTFVNQSVCNMSGYSEEELIGKPFTSLLHPDDLGSMLEHFQGSTANPDRSPHLEFRIVRQRRLQYPLLF